MRHRLSRRCSAILPCGVFLHVVPVSAQPPYRDDAAPRPATTPAVQPGAPAHDPAVQISAYIRCLCQDRDGRLWMGTNNDGVCVWDGTSLKFLNINDGLAGHAVRKIVQTADGAMWFATEGGVSRYHDGAFKKYTVADGLPSDDTWTMMLDSRGTLWVGTHHGVCRLPHAGDAKPEQPATTRFEPFAIPRAAVEDPASRFDPRLVWCIAEDRDANIWFGTDGEGARKYDGTSFTTYTTKDGLAGNQVRSVLADRHGHIWFGCEAAGATRFDGAAFRTFTANDGLGGDRVFVIYEDRDANLWFSTLAEGVSRYDGATFTAHRQLGGLPRTHVQSILQDKDGTLWFGCSGGLFRLEGDTFVNVTKNGPWR